MSLIPANIHWGERLTRPLHHSHSVWTFVTRHSELYPRSPSRPGAFPRERQPILPEELTPSFDSAHSDHHPLEELTPSYAVAKDVISQSINQLTSKLTASTGQPLSTSRPWCASPLQLGEAWRVLLSASSIGCWSGPPGLWARCFGSVSSHFVRSVSLKFYLFIKCSLFSLNEVE